MNKTKANPLNVKPIDGFTLIEMLVVIALLGILMMISSQIFLSSLKTTENDSSRMAATQNIQSATDIMVADIRQAGENLGSLSVGITGFDFNKSQQWFAVRKAIPTFTSDQLPATYPTTAAPGIVALPVCGIASESKILTVADSTKPTACPYNAVKPSDQNSDESNTYAWRHYFTLQDNRPQAAILYTPGTGTTATTSNRVIVTKVNDVVASTVSGVVKRSVGITLTPDSTIPASVTETNGSFIVMVDERRYRLNTDTKTLEFLQGGDPVGAVYQPLAFNITALTIDEVLNNPTTTIPSSSVAEDQNGTKWSRINKINLTLTGASPQVGTDKTSTLTTSIFPRNVENTRN